MLDVFELSCGTPSRYVVMLGLAGLDPTPRNRGLLSLRAVKSEKWVFGEKIGDLPVDGDTGVGERLARHGRDTHRQRLEIGGFFLRRDGDCGQLKRAGLPRPLGAGRRMGQGGRWQERATGHRIDW